MEQAYKTLKISSDVSDDELKRAYYFICSIYHPDKGGNKQTFDAYQRAYKTIINHRKNGCIGMGNVIAPSDFTSMKNRNNDIPISHDKYRFDPNQFKQSTADGTRFDNDKFNNNFTENVQSTEDYTYGVDDSGSHERNKAIYEQEHSKVTSQAENIKPMFGGSGFNNNTFNKVFEHMQKKYKKNTGELEEYTEPKPLAAGGIIECTDVNNPQQSANIISTGAADYNNAYNMSSNPEQYDKNFMEKIKNAPNIKSESTISSADVSKRLNEYHKAGNKFEYNKEKLLTDKNTILLDIKGHNSTKAAEALRKQQMNLYNTRSKISDMHDMKSRFITPSNSNVPIDRPQSTNNSSLSNSIEQRNYHEISAIKPRFNSQHTQHSQLERPQSSNQSSYKKNVNGYTPLISQHTYSSNMQQSYRNQPLKRPQSTNQSSYRGRENGYTPISPALLNPIKSHHTYLHDQSQSYRTHQLQRPESTNQASYNDNEYTYSHNQPRTYRTQHQSPEQWNNIQQNPQQHQRVNKKTNEYRELKKLKKQLHEQAKLIKQIQQKQGHSEW